MMEGWQACFIVLIVDLAAGRDLQVNPKSEVIRGGWEACPDVGYYFKRDPSPNAVDPGPCFLCFCHNNGNATCWERESRRCDVEKYHHHRTGRESRFRRSISLSDIFFRDASRDFFQKRLPEECEPFESSFSDGCPPADWCIGCTVCDCDANGRWDCHILSFCDGRETKKKVKAKGVLREKEEYKRKNEVKTSPSKPKTTTSTTTRPGKRINKKFVKAKLINKTQMKPKNANQTPKTKAVRQKTRKFNTQGIQPKKIMIKKPQSQKSQSQLQKHHHESKLNNATLILINKGGVNRKSFGLQRANLKKMINDNSNDTLKLGQKVVKHVMAAVQKQLLKEIEKINATKIQRSKNTGCTEAQKIENGSTNDKSKTSVKTKRKQKRKSYTIKDNFYSRYKREILNEPLSEIKNETLKTLLAENYSIIPLIDNGTIKLENNFSKNSKVDVTLDNSTLNLHQDDYYEYSVNNDRNKIATIKNETRLNKSDTFYNFVIPFESGNNISNSKINKIGDSNPLFNDLKFTKWFIIRIKNDKQKKSVERLILPKNKIFEDIQNAENANHKTKLQKKDIEMKYEAIKKQNFHNLVNRNYSILPTFSKTFSIRNESSLHNTLQNLLRELNKNYSGRQMINVMKYLKRFFHKIFSKKQSRTHKVYGIGTKEDHTLQMLCENVAPCKINGKNKLLLKYKLKQLNKETGTILKSIILIKGLLHMLELPNCDEITGNNKSSSFNYNIRKLSAILRDNYNIAEINASLADMQITQIKHIKKNTQVLIESVRKFADLLNETITLIRPDIEKYRFVEFSSKQVKNKIPFRSIIEMLTQYMNIQNNFTRKMYELIHGQEKKIPSTQGIQVHLRDNSTEKNIEKYSMSIIENLKKLKNLAKALSSKRKRRHIVGIDSTVEYLLTLMEYLIKQNYPLHTVRANDGIDYLLDAIKNAPDIKPINRNFLEVVTTPKTSDIHIFESEQILSDSNSESNRISKEEKQLNKDNISSDGIWVVEQNTEVIFDVTPKTYLRKNENETTIEHVTEKRSQEEIEKVGFEKFESNIDETKKFEVYAGDMEDDGNGDTDNGLSVMPNSTGINTKGVEEQNQSSTNTPEVIVTVTTQGKESSSESQDSRSDSKKTKLDWIEESFDREIREFSELNASYPSSTSESALSSAITVKYMTINNTENGSGITTELEDNTVSKNKSSKASTPDNVMYKKEIEFLNSLDYGTDHPDSEDRDSKDDTKSNDVKPNDEKSDEEFSSYFV